MNGENSKMKTTNALKVQDRDIVVPGEELCEGEGFVHGKNIYKKDNKLFAGMLGMVRVEKDIIKIIPLSGKYMPKEEDRVIGKVVDVLMSGWRFEINSAYSAVLPLKEAGSDFIPKGADLTKYFDFDDYVVAQITNVTTQNLVDLSTRGPGLKKLRGGRVIKVNPTKVPRIIGKDASMVKLLKDATGCDIQVGQNGLVWVSGDPEKEVLVINTIKKIEKESHTQGLTENIEAFLKGGKK